MVPAENGEFGALVDLLLFDALQAAESSSRADEARTAFCDPQNPPFAMRPNECEGPSAFQQL